MQARILWPWANYTGNLLWQKNKPVDPGKLSRSLNTLRAMGYWASAFPEGDGVTFKPERGQSESQMMSDFVEAFPWLDIEVGQSGDSNTELAALEEMSGAKSEIECVVMIPLERIHFEDSFEIGPFQFICAQHFQSPDEERLADCQGPYLQFNTKLNYAELLRSQKTLSASDLVITKCLAIAEHAMDVIRFAFSSFSRPQFTPNPAGQLESGFYAVEIIPCGPTHLKPLDLSGISRPMSASNNWLGPDVEDRAFRSRAYLTEVLEGRSDELALAVKAALRGCRQSFYSLGDESKFLNLVFTLDGLAHPEKNWTGWKQRTYIAALVSNGNLSRFEGVLEHYNALYEVRNALVHKGSDFYETGQDPATCSQDLYEYIRDVVKLIGDRNLEKVDDLHQLAKSWLTDPTWVARYQAAIKNICISRGMSKVDLPKW